ncbi:LPD11 domain-containing protein [Burkholderia ubonensis]|nr:LPD11 domain-containing protein [Burkholderia ubonensis]
MTQTDDSRDVFNYQLLARLQQDCEYYLGFGHRAKKHLWAGDEAEQIQKMKELYEGFSEKPEWLTLEDIERYEAAMITAVEPSPSASTPLPKD